MLDMNNNYSEEMINNLFNNETFLLEYNEYSRNNNKRSKLMEISRQSVYLPKLNKK